MIHANPFHSKRRRPYRRRASQSSPTPRAATHTVVRLVSEHQELGTLQNGDEAAHHRPRMYTDREPRAIGEGSHTGSLRQLAEGRSRREFVNTRVNAWLDSLEFFPLFPRRVPSPLAQNFSPHDQFISTPSYAQVHQKPLRISCAIRVEGCEIIGNPFVANGAAFALFSANPGPDDVPCLRLEFDLMQLVRTPFDKVVIQFLRGYPLAHSLVNAVNLGPYFQQLKAPTVRWYVEHVKDLDYRRGVELLGDRIGDADVIQSCPGETLGECLIRMTWVSTSPFLWRYNEDIQAIIVPHIRANLDALEDKHQSKKITIWFINPWGRDATHLQGLVQSLSRRRST